MRFFDFNFRSLSSSFAPTKIDPARKMETTTVLKRNPYLSFRIADGDLPLGQQVGVVHVLAVAQTVAEKLAVNGALLRRVPLQAKTRGGLVHHPKADRHAIRGCGRKGRQLGNGGNDHEDDDD